MASSIEEWCAEELNKLLKTSSEEVARYLISIANDRDFLETFVNEVLVGVSESEKSAFLNKLKSKITSVKEYRKSNFSDGQESLQPKNVSHKKKAKHYSRDPGEASNISSSVSSKQSEQGEVENIQSATHRRKPRFVSIYSPEGKARDIILFPGRNPCTCLASKHALINNCLSCGRIVCKQEGSGPCFTCNQWVGTPQEMQERKRLGMQDLSEFEDESIRQAREQRDRLLACSKDGEESTRVIDDQTDFYTSEYTKWMSAEEKKAIHRLEDIRERAKAARHLKKFTLDFAGRKVIECNDISEPVLPSFQNVVPKSFYESANKNEISSNVSPYIDFEPPLYIDEHKVEGEGISTKLEIDIRQATRNLRIQDCDLQLMSDDGMCLSMHQPWASLLISGIKLHEGRSWYTPHRGCLWIHAAKKEPKEADITEVLNNIQPNRSKSVVFPKHYPTSCLLGCVTVIDCLPQEEYRVQCPYGESGSPYVFICENPQELVVKLPMNGKHKIFKMDPNIHFAAKKAQKRSTATNWQK